MTKILFSQFQLAGGLEPEDPYRQRSLARRPLLLLQAVDDLALPLQSGDDLDLLPCLLRLDPLSDDLALVPALDGDLELEDSTLQLDLLLRCLPDYFDLDHLIVNV